ncbi:hypothetical protein Q4Q35_07485 [Flavivirga aquimarina]|uniref:Serine protease n=1 Tax=Flavivirga aquimarina TaxID=2027862 RepID=A0ABT8W951_9FLAO|nr:hypothetical protein [Flavivirga aquimarina]MDO5969645.1 hypothetical protein [Flavivirga aquimarina]
MKQQLCAPLLFFFSCFLFAQETVFVKSTEIGNGIICERAGECFVITPAHVVSESVSDILVRSANRINNTANLIDAYEADLAILGITKSSSTTCKSWDISDQFDRAIDNVSSGFVEYLDEFGASNMVHVNITSKDQTSFIIIPQNANIGFRKGMSGSSFYINYQGEKILAGMLMSMEDDSKQAFVYQIDDIMRTLASFFDVKRQVETTYNGPKRLGVMLLKDNNRYVEVNNKLVTNINKGTSYKAYDKFAENDYVEKEFDNIVLGRSDLVIPSKLRKELDQLFLGNVIFETETNRKNMHTVYVRLNASLYLTNNLNVIDSYSFMGKGLGFDEKTAEKQAIKSLLTNMENQFK